MTQIALKQIYHKGITIRIPEIWNAETGMIHSETVHRGAEFFQGNPSIGHNHKSIITAPGEKVMTNF